MDNLEQEKDEKIARYTVIKVEKKIYSWQGNKNNNNL